MTGESPCPLMYPGKKGKKEGYTHKFIFIIQQQQQQHQQHYISVFHSAGLLISMLRTF